MRGFTLVEFLVVIAVGGTLSWLSIYGIAQAITKQQCLRAGYAEFDVDFRLRAYCIQRDYNGVMKAIPKEEAIQ